jgi:hypothetical protein
MIFNKRGASMRQTNKLLIVFAAAGVMLAACGGEGGGGNVSQLMKGDNAQPQQQAPAPQVQRVEVTRIVKDVQQVPVEVEVTRIVPQDVVREVIQQVFVEVTPEPAQINNFGMSASGGCNTYEALPYHVEDDGTIYGEYPICAWETAVALSNEVQP